MDLIWTYKFEDGVELFLINKGFSTEELLELTELHGKVEVGAKKAKIVWQ